MLLVASRETDAVLVMVVRAVVMVPTIVIVALAPLTISPSSHWTSGARTSEQDPTDGVTEVMEYPVGKESVTVTELAVSGPALFMESV